jgi:PKD repeat protein
MRRPFSLLIVVVIACVISSIDARQSSGDDSTFKVAFLNIKAGKGQQGLAGHACSFQDTTNCTDTTQPLNAWGLGVVQDELIRAVQSDPEVIAIGLAESWETLCGSARQVQALFGWAARTSTHNGIAMVARYGFAGPEEWVQLDTSLNSNTADTMWVVRAPVCMDAACSKSVQVFASHWYADGVTRIQTFERQAQQTADFLATLPADTPGVLVGDLNVWEEGGTVCNQTPVPTAMQILRDGGNTDAWPTIHGTAEGYTGMWNRNGCGDPVGYLWKRIDQAWSRVVVPIGMTRFGMVTPGDCAPSDHAGIVTRYLWPSTKDVTAPSVEVTAPAAGAVVSGNVLVTIAATDDTGVSRVGVTVDGAPLGTGSSAPYEVTWDTTTVANGAHTVQAWAEDAAGNLGTSTAIAVTVQNTTPNSPPVSAFTAACTNLNCNFSDKSTDADGGIAAWLWNFGDGAGSSVQNPTHSFAAAGTYTVSLKVTDTGGATSTSTQSITVTQAASFDFTVTASPASKRINAGASTAFTVSTLVISGTPVPIALSVTGLPAGTGASFSPSTLAGSGSSKLTIVSSADAPAGTFALTISAAGGGVVHTTSVTLTIRRR